MKKQMKPLNVRFDVEQVNDRVDKIISTFNGNSQPSRSEVIRAALEVGLHHMAYTIINPKE